MKDGTNPKGDVSFNNALTDSEASGKTLSEEELFDKIRNSVVMVTAGEKHASGIIVDITNEKVVMLTAGHLMTGFDQGIITFATGNAGFGDVVYISENPDLCILSFKTECIDESLLKQLTYMKVDISNFDNLSEGDEVYFLGSAIATGSNATKGTVASKNFYMSDYDAWMLYLYADVMAGMSGCGVFDSDGELVGILCAGNGSGEAVAIKLSDIIDKLEVVCYDKD
ncbi:MAG: serine protease [Lachnospiraceae bacterium]|nr:serine protease [Lachnospiraceae bacterium]